MTPEQQLVQQIGQLLAGNQLENRELLEDYAVQFAEMCRLANERLARCADYLDKGRRSEAVYEARLSPDLLELEQLLQGDGLRKWRNVCLDLELAQSQPLNGEVIARLRQASGDEAALEPLLKEYRRSVYQSDHARCIELLRKIREKDSANPSWAENLRPLEESFLPGWLERAERGLERMDLADLKVVFNELNHPMRAVKAPDDLMKRLRRALLAERSIDLKADGNHLMSQLKAAMENGDTADMERLWDECRKLEQDEAFLERPANWSKTIEESHAKVEALAKQREKSQAFAQELSRLKDMLMENKASSLDIRHAYERLETWEMPIPELVSRQVKELLSQRQAVIRRKRTAVMLSVLSVVILLLAAGGVTAYFMQRSRTRNDILARAQQFARNRDYDELGALMEAVRDSDSELYNAPELTGMRNDMENERRLLDEKRRTYSAMKATLEEVRRMDYRGDDAGIRRTVEDAQAAAVTPEQKEYIQRWKNEWLTFKADLEVKMDEKVQPGLNALNDRLEKMARREGQAVLAEWDEINELYKDLLRISVTDVANSSAAVRERHGKLTGAVESRLADCRQRKGAYEAKLAQEKAELAAVADELNRLRTDIPMALPNFDRYESLLDTFVEKGKAAPESGDYSQIIAHLGEYRKVTAIQGLGLGENILSNEARKKVEAFLADGHPAGMSVWRSDLERLKRMIDLNNQMRRKVGAFISLKKNAMYVMRYRRLEEDAWHILYSERPFHSQQRDGVVFYWGNALWAGENDSKVTPIDTAKLNGGENFSSQAFEVKLSPLTDDNLAPHVVLLKRMVPAAQRAEDVALYIVRELDAFKGRTDIDPVQGLVIFKQFAGLLALNYADELPEARDWMQKAGAINTAVPWQREDHPLTVEARGKIAEFWAQMPDMAPFVKRMEWNRKLLRAVLNTELHCVGSIQLDENGVRRYAPREQASELWMFVPTGGIPSFRVPEMADGTVLPRLLTPFAAGMPVFAPLAGRELRPVWEAMKEEDAALLERVVRPQALPVDLK